MHCRLVELHSKDVISIQNGARLGCVGDVEIDARCGQVVALIILGRPRLLGLLGRTPDLTIPWQDVRVVGEETVLVACDPPRPKRPRRKGLAALLAEW